jgi:hypothetical protein
LLTVWQTRESGSSASCTPVKICDALGQRPLILTEPANALSNLGVLPLIMLSEFHVATDRHEVDDIVGEQPKPILEPSLVEQLDLPVEEILHILPQLVMARAPLDRGQFCECVHGIASLFRAN